MYMYIPLMLDTYPGKACPAISTLVIIFHISNQLGLRCSDPFKSSPGSHSLLVSDSIGTTSTVAVNKKFTFRIRTTIVVRTENLRSRSTQFLRSTIADSAIIAVPSKWLNSPTFISGYK